MHLPWIIAGQRDQMQF